MLKLRDFSILGFYSFLLVKYATSKIIGLNDLN